MSDPRPTRRMRGFESAARLVAAPVRAAGESRGFAVAKLLTHWPEVAGAQIAAQAQPVKIGYGREGMGATLTLLTTGPNAPLLEMQKERLRERVNACYGYNAIARIRITQTAPSGFAEGQASFTSKPKPAPAPDPALRAQAQAETAEIADPGLRAALAALAENLLSRPQRTKG